MRAIRPVIVALVVGLLALSAQRLPAQSMPEGALNGRDAGQPLLRVAASDNRGADIEFWKSIKNSTDPAEFEAYLKTFPNGSFAPLARIRLNRLESESSTESTAEPATAPLSTTSAPAPNEAAAPVTRARPAGSAATAGVGDFTAGEPGWIGVELAEPSADQTNGEPKKGAIVAAVVSNGPAAKADIRADDVIVEVDGQPVRDGTELRQRISRLWPGREVEFIVLRAGRKDIAGVRVGGLLTDNQKAAAAGEAGAMFALARAYADGNGVTRDIAAARDWYKKAADAGHAGAQTALADLYMRGEGGFKDARRAATLYDAAARQGDVRAMVALGRLYQEGEGIAKDEAEAARWIGAAARTGHSRAEAALGRMYARGNGVAKDPERGVVFSRRAMEKGNLDGQNDIAIALWTGEGIGKDRDEAVALWRDAALRGHGKSIRNLRRLDVSLYDVAAIQSALADLGYDPGPVDGQEGPNTRAAIKQFQLDRGVEADGEPSLELVALLGGGGPQDPPRGGGYTLASAPPEVPEISREEAARLSDF